VGEYRRPTVYVYWVSTVGSLASDDTTRPLAEQDLVVDVGVDVAEYG
jgi:hypothetical protein